MNNDVDNLNASSANRRQLVGALCIGAASAAIAAPAYANDKELLSSLKQARDKVLLPLLDLMIHGEGIDEGDVSLGIRG